MKKITPAQIEKRMIEWRNLKVLHQKAIGKNEKLRKENKMLREKLREYEEKNNILKKRVEELELQVEELREIIFGGKNKGDKNKNDFFLKKKKPKPKQKRFGLSYRRSIPEAEEITEIKEHGIAKCPDCETKLTRKRIYIFYEEDIKLPDGKEKLKQVSEHRVEKGYCKKCRKWHAAKKIPCAKVMLGTKVKIYICYLNILLRMSYQQIQDILFDTFHFKISDGEISNILDETGRRLRAEFERINERINQGKGVNLDETGWSKGTYAWVKAAIETEEVIYLFNRSRGKGNLAELLGDNFKKIRINDGYSAYKNAPGKGQRCWAHPETKLEQLAYSSALSEEAGQHCEKTYIEFSRIYEKLRGYLKEKYDKRRRELQKKELMAEIKKFRRPNEKDPKKLQNIKKGFHDYEKEWLTCLDYEGVPCDNNKAERKLRHIVLKRKISFGNKSEQGARALEVNASVLMTHWYSCRDLFFPKIRDLLA